jgi:hypothetical protein
MSIEARSEAGFDPNFDDTVWTDAWMAVPVALVPATQHPSGYRVRRELLHQAEIFGRPYRLAGPFDCRLLYDPEGRLWMSNTPQEHMMMYNNAARSWGDVLVGGLGLGLYPQYAAMGAAGQATRFRIIERSPVVRDLVAPVLRRALDVPWEILIADVEGYLAASPQARFDTVFLDTWDTLDAANLPAINSLRDRALAHLAPGGRLLLWGYRWMVRLFEDACRQLLGVRPAQRADWLQQWVQRSPQAALLLPVAERFDGHSLDAQGMDEALSWCRAYIVSLTG